MRRNHLSVVCACGHSGLVPLDEWARRLPSGRVCDVLGRLRCSHCGARGRMRAQIIYVGDSGVAMRGSDVPRGRQG